jgi:hypothetical protein
MFHIEWMGLEALTIVMVGKHHPQELAIDWGREKNPLDLNIASLPQA